MQKWKASELGGTTLYFKISLTKFMRATEIKETKIERRVQRHEGPFKE